MQSLLRRFDPRLEAIAVPMFWPDPDQHDPSRLDEQGAQIAIAAFRYLAKDGAITGRGLFRDKAQPSSEVAAFRERIAGADCGLASASRKSFFCPLEYGRTYFAGIRRAS